MRQARTSLAESEKRNLLLLLLIVLMVVLFRIGYEQSGNVIALWVSDRTDRTLSLFGSTLAIPATWFQAINPLLIILLTPVLIRFWRAIRARETTPDLLRRMSIGCVIGAASMLLLVAAAMASGPEGARVSPWWTLGYFFLLTVGELLVIPVGLTLIETLAPARVASTAMGGWYIAKFLGSLLAGVMGAFWLKIPAASFFALGMLSMLLAAAALFGMSRVQRPRG